MILTQLLVIFAFTLSPAGNPPGIYEHSGHLETTIDCDINIDSSNASDAVYFKPYVRISCDTLYDNVDSYYLNNFRFRLYVDSYRLPRHANTPTLIQSNYADYEPNWEFTKESYNHPISNLKCAFFTDIGNDLLYITWDYNNEQVSSSSFEFAYTNDDSSESTYTISDSSFINSVESVINSRYQEGYADGEEHGYQVGYTDGISDAMESSGEMFTIFNGILNVAAIPINVFLAIFNFEVFGINISSLVSALLSVCILIIVIRVVTGKKSE